MKFREIFLKKKIEKGLVKYEKSIKIYKEV